MARTDVIVDASFFVSLYRPTERRYDEAWAWYEGEPESGFVTTPVVLAEMDYMLRKHGGRAAARIVAAHTATGALDVEWWDAAPQAIWKIVDARPDIDVADASLVALAAHRRTVNIATYDHRHFGSLQPLTGEPAFTLLP